MHCDAGDAAKNKQEPLWRFCAYRLAL